MYKLHHHNILNILEPTRLNLSKGFFVRALNMDTGNGVRNRNPLGSRCRVALVQMKTGWDKARNLVAADKKVTEAAVNGADIVVLPEFFNSPYSTSQFRKYAEPVAEDAPTYSVLSALSKRLSITLIAGSIPELDPANDKIYNTSLAFGPTGSLLAKHRKVHLFDINVPGGVSFCESGALSAGSTPSVVPTKWGNIGLGICYDVRFPELAMIAARRHGAFLMVYPAAFNMTTGPLHWDLLARARAVDNQMYVAMASPARLPSEPQPESQSGEREYIPWGASIIVDPNGEILAKAGISEETVVAELTPERIAAVRTGIPVTVQRRFDVYCDVGGEG